MFRHNLILILRTFKRNKSSFFLNLIGLSTGLACAILIFLWVNDELNFDKFHEKDSQLFQVMQNWKTSKSIDTFEGTPGPLPETLVKEMPEVEYAAAVFDASIWGIPTISVKGKYIKAHCLYVDKDFFNIFSFNITGGRADHVLTNKNSMVISEDLALKLFSTTENLIGKEIEFNNNTFLISGIFEDIPSHSTLQFDFVVMYDLLKEGNPRSFYDWSNNAANTYVILKHDTDIKQFNDKISGLIERKNGDSFRTLFVRPYSDNYLYGTYQNDKQAGGRIEYVKLFSIIAIFILIIACINFMNLSTARASRRIKEIGMKKALGSDRKVLGSSAFGIVYLLSGDFTKIVLASIFISLPVSYFIAKLWLDSFANRIDLHIWYFIGAGLITLFIAWITVGIQAIKAARINPIESIRYE
jgi:putative ABC transport system permease protein